MPAVVFIAPWIRNVYGYYRAKAHALAQGQQINNNLNKLYETIGLYMGSAAVFLKTIPQPYEIVALAIIFASDTARTELAAILE